MLCLLSAPLAILLVFDLTFHLLLVLRGVVIPPVTYRAFEGYEFVCSLDFGHA